MSYDAAWRAGDDKGSDKRLIDYLWRNKHTSPFEAVSLTFEIKAPIFVFRQWHRHRTWSYNELSARYRELPEEFYVPEILAVGVQAKDNKQARTLEDLTEEQKVDRQDEIHYYMRSCQGSFRTYKDLIAAGWPRELARMILPVSTYSHMFASVNLLNLFRFLMLRDHSHAQMEIRVYAEALKELARDVAPISVKALEDHVWELRADDKIPG